MSVPFMSGGGKVPGINEWSKSTGYKMTRQPLIHSQVFLQGGGKFIASKTVTNLKDLNLIHKQVQAVKESEKMGVRYMQRWEELAEARDEGHSAGLAEGHSAGLAEGRSAGLIEGCAEGEEKKLIRMVCKKLCKGMETKEVVKEFTEEFGEDTQEVERICEAAKEFAPEYDCDGIYGRLHGV